MTYALLGPLEDFIRRALFFIHDNTSLSWAWSIIALTVVVRIILVPLTVKQMRSMQAMQRLQPEMRKLQEKYKDDRQKLNQELMAFYKENKLNPFGSCLPLVLQLPVFFSLFFVLRHFASNPPPGDLSFLGSFITDITEHTNKVGFAGVILIVLYVLSQLGSTLLMPSTMDKTQRYLFMAMPFFFVIFVINFPVGLMLYWITTNLWTVGQQAVIRKTIPMPPPTPGAANPFGDLFKRPQRPGGGGSPAKPRPAAPRGSGPKGAPPKGTAPKPVPRPGDGNAKPGEGAAKPKPAPQQQRRSTGGRPAQRGGKRRK